MSFKQEAEQLLKKAYVEVPEVPGKIIGLSGNMVEEGATAFYKSHLKGVREELEEVYNYGDDNFVNPQHIKDRIAEIDKELGL